MTRSSPTCLANLRDVAHTDPSLVDGVLLRSDAPHHGDDHSGYPVTWPPRTVVALRDPAERIGGHPLAGSAAVVSLPVLNGTAYDVANLPRTLGQLYLDMLEQPSAGFLVTAVKAIATGDGPVLVHCAGGKDRTGVTIALVLSLLGVEREAIVRDYVATGEAMSGVTARLATTHARLVDGEALANLPSGLSTAPPEAITAVLDAWNAHESGPEGWYRDHGGTPASLAALRGRLLVRGVGVARGRDWS